MESESGFDLDASVNGWRRSLEQQRGLTSDRIRELVQHLVESMERLQERGLTAEESFWIARRRLGSPETLAEEFIKADPAAVWRERLMWMILGLFVFRLWGSFLSPFMLLVFSWRAPGGVLGFIVTNVVCSVLALAPLFLGLLLIRRSCNRRFEPLERLLGDRRRALIAAVSIAGGIWVISAVVVAVYPDTRSAFPNSWVRLANEGISSLSNVSLGVIVYWLLPARSSKKAA